MRVTTIVNHQEIVSDFEKFIQEIQNENVSTIYCDSVSFTIDEMKKLGEVKIEHDKNVNALNIWINNSLVSSILLNGLESIQYNYKKAIGGVYFCPICGYATKDMEFSIGDICDCCGCEMCFNDDITEDDLEIEFDESIIKKYQSEIEKDFKRAKDQGKYVAVTKELAWKLLRIRWIRNGFIWKWNDKNQKPTNWEIEKAEEQLKNIGVDIKDYM